MGLKANWGKNWIYIKALMPVFLTLIFVVLALDNLQNIIICNKGCFSKNGSASKLWKALNPKPEKLKFHQSIYLIRYTDWWDFSLSDFHVLDLELFKVWGGAVFSKTPLISYDLITKTAAVYSADKQTVNLII